MVSARSLLQILERDNILSAKRDEELRELILDIQHEDRERHVLLALKGDEAASVLDVLLKHIDTCANGRDNSYLVHAIRKLSLNSGQLPPSLFLKDVSCPDKEPVGGGGYADVWKGSYQGILVAVKRLRVFGSPTEDKLALTKDILREALVWRQLRHPNVLPFLGVSSTAQENRVGLVSPWMGRGTLIDFVKLDISVDHLSLIRGVAEGLKYLHGKKPPVLHGDMRGSNILIDEWDQPKLSDFGLAHVISTHPSTIVQTTTSPKGSTRWMACEIFVDDASGHTAATDVWAFGCTCFEILTRGHHPYRKLRLDSQVILKIYSRMKPDDPQQGLEEREEHKTAWRVMRECWLESVTERPTMSHIVAALTMESSPTEGHVIENDHQTIVARPIPTRPPLSPGDHMLSTLRPSSSESRSRRPRRAPGAPPQRPPIRLQQIDYFLLPDYRALYEIYHIDATSARLPPLSRDLFEEVLRMHTAQQDVDATLLSFEYQTINLYTLHTEVVKRGGLQLVNEKKLWSNVGLSMGCRPFFMTELGPELAPGIVARLVFIYNRYLSSVEVTNAFLSKLSLPNSSVGDSPTSAPPPNVASLPDLLSQSDGFKAAIIEQGNAAQSSSTTPRATFDGSKLTTPPTRASASQPDVPQLSDTHALRVTPKPKDGDSSPIAKRSRRIWKKPSWGSNSSRSELPLSTSPPPIDEDGEAPPPPPPNNNPEPLWSTRSLRSMSVASTSSVDPTFVGDASHLQVPIGSYW